MRQIDGFFQRHDSLHTCLASDSRQLGAILTGRGGVAAEPVGVFAARPVVAFAVPAPVGGQQVALKTASNKS